MTTSEALAIQRCPNCPDASTRSVFRDDGGHVLECCSCGLRFAEHYPDLAAEEGVIYGPEYFRKAIDQWNERSVIYGSLVAEIEGVIGRTGRLLDVGAGEGGLLKAASDRGWSVEGTEVATAMVGFVQRKLGVGMHLGELEALSLAAGSYDAIVMNHVLEHVRNPGTTLRAVARLLRPDGVVRVEVPNVASLSSRIKNAQSRMRLKRQPWKHYSTGHHYWFFTPPTLRRTFEAAGLRVVKLRAPARQWEPIRPMERALNAAYRGLLLGGHLVAYGRPA